MKTAPYERWSPTRTRKSSLTFITGLGGSYFMYKEIGALDDMRMIPESEKQSAGNRRHGRTLGRHAHALLVHGLQHRHLKREDMPKRWDDLFTNRKFRNGNLALGNRPQLWALSLWKANGEKWAKDFLAKLLNEVKPQLRREGMNAMLELTAAGEFYASVPSAEYRTYQKQLAGAPVGYHCPEPVPAAVSEMGILKGAPNINAARIFVNWFLSKEGQIAQYVGGLRTAGAQRIAAPRLRSLRRRNSAQEKRFPRPPPSKSKFSRSFWPTGMSFGLRAAAGGADNDKQKDKGERMKDKFGRNRNAGCSDVLPCRFFILLPLSFIP